ncbi:MAG: heat-inducible transcriptional repressor HrcA [Thermomicrobiaceae bacterium]
MTGELSARQRKILKLIVQDYVQTGRAVGSKALIDRYKLSVSPATVRNDMGVLEEQDYLQHLHTSAGRVPTDSGYRYYVENLLGNPRVPLSDQIRIRHQFSQVEMQVAASMKLAAAVLAEASGNIALISPPRSLRETVRHFELISLRDRLVLLILVTQSGTVHESFLHLDEPLAQEALSETSRRLNDEIRDLQYREIKQRSLQQDALGSLVLEQIASLMRRTEQESSAELHSEGLERALRQPEFSQGEVAQHLLEVLRGGALLSVLLPQVSQKDDLRIFIGSENVSDQLQSYGVIIARYGATNEVTGLLGILGPTRMPYDRSISTLRYVSQVLSDLLRHVHTDELEH